MARTVDICRIDFITRYLRLERQLPSKKDIYYSLNPGELWKDYYHFAYWVWCYKNRANETKKRNRHISILRQEFYKKFNTQNIISGNIYDILHDEYPGLWKSRNHFYKKKSHYLSRRFVSIS